MESVARLGKNNPVLAGKGAVFSSDKSRSYQPDTKHNRFMQNLFLWKVTLHWIPACS
jgi:hypothetical protein